MPIAEIQKVTIALAAVISLVLLIAYGLRAWRSRNPLGATDLEVLSATYVGPKERVLLLRVRDRELLIGVSAQQICALGELQHRKQPVGQRAGEIANVLP